MSRAHLLLLTPILFGSAAPAYSSPGGLVFHSPRSTVISGRALEPVAQDVEARFETLVAGRDPQDPAREMDSATRLQLIHELAGSPREGLLALLNRVAKGPASVEARTAGLDLLARMASSAELSLSFELVGSQAVPEKPVRLGLQDVLTRLHDLEPAVALALEPHFLAANPVVQDVCLKALDENPSRESIQLFAKCLGAGESGLDVALLARMGNAWSKKPGWIESRHVDRVHGLSLSSDVVVARQAISSLALGRDTRDAERWIGLLESPSPALAQTAHWALKQVTGLNHGNRPAAWKTWLATSRQWQVERKTEALAELRGENRTLVVRALREISGQKLDRRELAIAVAEQLSHQDALVASTAVATLRALRSPAAIDPLLEVLERGTPEWNQLCHDALCVLTGLDCESTRPAWRQALGLDEPRP